MTKRVMVLYGTRPEAIKVAPLIKELERSEELHPLVVVTGQHREILDQVNEFFGIEPDVDLNLFEPGQSLNHLASKIFSALDPVLAEFEPDAVVVQGDTSTVAFGAIAAFQRGIPVVHLEAGLRSGDIMSPFPEEANRKLVGQVASLHLAPTLGSRANLQREDIDENLIAVTGNTVVDALHYTVDVRWEPSDPVLRRIDEEKSPMLLLTTHRRENWGAPMESIGRAVARIAVQYPQMTVVFPAHPNPKVRAAIEPAVEGLDNVHIIEPQDYVDFANLQRMATIVLTDSGGVQEEAPSLGKPVLVLRDNTERPEAVGSGTVRLIGTDEDRIVAEVTRLMDDPDEYVRMSTAVNPYGDGHAAQRAVAAIGELLGVDVRMPDFGLERDPSSTVMPMPLHSSREMASERRAG